MKKNKTKGLSRKAVTVPVKKLQVGDNVLIIGPAHYDKATVVEVNGDEVLLDNQMRINHKYENLVNSSMFAKPWNEEEFNHQRAVHRINGNLNLIRDKFNKLPKEDAIEVNHKLERIIEKFNLKELY